MKNRLLTSILLISGAVCLAIPSNGQSLINASGGSKELNTNTYEWSIGGIVTSTEKPGNKVITQGLLQPMYVSLGVASSPELARQVSVYPNPARDFLTIAPRLQANTDLQYRVTDLSGKSLISQSVNLAGGQELEKINLKQLSPGIYLLQIQTETNTGTAQAAFRFEKRD